MTEIAPPGRAQITECNVCAGGRRPGRCPDGSCDDCGSTGWLIWHACPRCGDGAWHYVNGFDDTQGMRCHDPRCGYQWDRDDPGWQAQRLPDDLVLRR